MVSGNLTCAITEKTVNEIIMQLSCTNEKTILKEYLHVIYKVPLYIIANCTTEKRIG